MSNYENELGWVGSKEEKFVEKVSLKSKIKKTAVFIVGWLLSVVAIGTVIGATTNGPGYGPAMVGFIMLLVISGVGIAAHSLWIIFRYFLIYEPLPFWGKILGGYVVTSGLLVMVAVANGGNGMIPTALMFSVMYLVTVVLVEKIISKVGNLS